MITNLAQLQQPIRILSVCVSVCLDGWVTAVARPAASTGHQASCCWAGMEERSSGCSLCGRAVQPCPGWSVLHCLG